MYEEMCQKELILSCFKNVGIDTSLIEEDENIFIHMDSLQYIAFISEIENRLKIVLVEEFLNAETFNSFQDFVTKLEYYVKGWNQSIHNKSIMEGGE